MIGSKAIDQAIPFSIPGLSNDIKEGIKQLQGLMESTIKTQTDKVVDKVKDTDQNKKK